MNTALSKKDIRIVDKQTVFQGFFSIQQYRLKHRLFNGQWSKVLTRELFARSPVAAVLPFDPVTKQVVMIEQFRLGALAQEDPWLLEIVAGIIESEEKPEAMVKREAQEEAGLLIEELWPMYQYWTSPGGTNEHMTLFCGKVDAANAGGIYGAKDEGEDIRVAVLSIDEAIAALTNGCINNSVTIIALQWLQLHYDKVLSKWT